MRPITYTVAGTAQSPVAVIDPYISPSNVALNVQVTGTVDYTVQYTFDDIFAANYSPSAGSWTNHPTLTTQTTTKDSNIAYPVRGVRILLNSGTGTAKLTIIQGGGAGLA